LDDRLLGALAEARALGFLGPGPLEAHVHSAAAFVEALGVIDGSAVDLGSGGGVPGLLLAEHYTEVRWTLVDQHRRRTSFLARTVANLGWAGRVEVVRAAAEALAHDPARRRRSAVVVARSFAPPAVTAEVGAGFLQVGGRLAVAEPPEPDPAHWPPGPLATLGLERTSADGAAIAVFVAGDVPADVPRAWPALQRRPAWVVSRGTSGGPG
jgi:16S rRNA (guanine527-N7)-methyltransferase